MGTVSTAVETRNEQKALSARNMIMQYRDELTNVMPSHLTEQNESWLRIAAGALKTGKIAQDGSGRFELEVAATNNPAAFMQALRKAASQGLQPGTEEFYLTARKNKGVLEILGITGYMGYIELMYRAGYVTKVVTETVHEADTWSFDRNYDERPHHGIDYRSKEPRGDVELVYAYAEMRGGGTSYVVVMTHEDIERIKKKSPSAGYPSSPWNTDEAAMWKKTAVRQLRKFVPTSTEVRGPGGAPLTIPTTAAEVQQAEARAALISAGPVGQVQLAAVLQHEDPSAVIEGEVDDETGEPPADPEPETAPEPAAEEPVDAELVEPQEPEGPPAADDQIEKPVTPEEAPAAEPAPGIVPAQGRQLKTLFSKVKITDGVAQLDWASTVLGQQVDDMNLLTFDQANTVIKALTTKAKAEA